MAGVKNLLVRHSKPNNLLFVGELVNNDGFKPKMVTYFAKITVEKPFFAMFTLLNRIICCASCPVLWRWASTTACRAST